MQKQQTITAKEYLTKKGISFRESGKELISHCLFNDCDKDSKGKEAHLYFDAETGQYECKKCGEKGNLITLAKHFGEGVQEIALNQVAPTKKTVKFHVGMVDSCHLALPTNIRNYLNERGISNSVIDAQKLGWGNFYNQWWITIPIADIHGIFRFFKLRQDPNIGSKKTTYPNGIEAQIYGWETLTDENKDLVICEGELDRLALLSKEVLAVTSTHGAMTFKDEWCEKIPEGKKIYICFDNDDTGRKGAERVAKLLENTKNDVYIVTLPQEVGEHGDVTDYFTKLNGNTDDLFGKYAKEYPEKIDTSQFNPLTSEELIEILELTIKQDNENKIVTFLCELSAYTENAQFNISYNAPSSTGKSYIPLEISNLFPSEDVMKLGNCSPTAFFHEQGKYDKDKNTITVDLSRKIIIFLDQPHNSLLERLRSMLSHDGKEMHSKITDKNQQGGNRTKTVIIKGFPAVIFCTAGLAINEQEATRFLLLSPEINQDKIRQGILASIKKEADPEGYKNRLNENPERKLLKERIKAIKQAGIGEIKIASFEKIEAKFLGENKMLKPRHQRDIKRLTSLIKSFALINLWWRDKSGTTITANDDDINQAFKVWDMISVSQDLNLPPYIYDLYKEIILKAWNDKNHGRNDVRKFVGLSRQELLHKHYDVYHRTLDPNLLRQQILPMLETTGLIVQEPDHNDNRKMLIYPTALVAKSSSSNDGKETTTTDENNSETRSGVNNNEIEENLLSDFEDFIE